MTLKAKESTGCISQMKHYQSGGISISKKKTSYAKAPFISEADFSSSLEIFVLEGVGQYAGFSCRGPASCGKIVKAM